MDYLFIFGSTKFVFWWVRCEDMFLNIYTSKIHNESRLTVYKYYSFSSFGRKHVYTYQFLVYQSDSTLRWKPYQQPNENKKHKKLSAISKPLSAKGFPFRWESRALSCMFFLVWIYNTAQSGCLDSHIRWRTYKAAISSEELLRRVITPRFPNGGTLSLL